jgi:ankyrin repeat protein
MKTRTLNLLAGLTAVLTALAADPLTEWLQKGLLEEEVNRDLPAAVRAYEKAVELADTQRRAAATAVFRLAETYRKLGRTNDAVAKYRRILEQFGDQAPLAALSRTNLALLAPGRAFAVAPEPTDAVTAEEIAELTRVRAIIQNSPDLVNARNATTNKGTLLHKAAGSGYLVLAEFLLVHGAEVNATDQFRRTPLHLAADAGHKRLCELLLAKGGDVNAADSKGFTPLHFAAAKGYLAVAETLLAAGAKVNTKTPPDAERAFSNERESSPLHFAAENGFPAVVELLLQHGAEINARDRGGQTPLVRAIGKNQPATVRRLLEKGADPNALDAQGSSPLFWAVVENQGSVVPLLLDHKAEVDARITAPEPEGDWTVLFQAVGDGNVELSRQLLDAGADPNARAASGITPVHWAVLQRQPATLQLLLERKADVNCRDTGGNTPLHYALDLRETLASWARSGTQLDESVEAAIPGLVSILLAAGADPNAPGWNGGPEKSWPPLCRAIKLGERWRIPVMAALLKHGADVNAGNASGWTALHQAVEYNLQDVVEFLVTNQANINARGSRPTGSPVLGKRRAVRAGASGQPEPAEETGAQTAMRFERNQPGVLLPSRPTGPRSSTPLGVKDVTPLHVAVDNFNRVIVELLLAHGADVNARDAQGRTPLHFAVIYRDIELARVLLDAKADPNAKDAAGLTPLQAVRGVPPAEWTRADRPSLELIVYAQPKDLERLLLERGASPEHSTTNASPDIAPAPAHVPAEPVPE